MPSGVSMCPMKVEEHQKIVKEPNLVYVHYLVPRYKNLSLTSTVQFHNFVQRLYLCTHFLLSLCATVKSQHPILSISLGNDEISAPTF